MSDYLYKIMALQELSASEIRGLSEGTGYSFYDLYSLFSAGITQKQIVIFSEAKIPADVACSFVNQLRRNLAIQQNYLNKWQPPDDDEFEDGVINPTIS